MAENEPNPRIAARNELISCWADLFDAETVEENGRSKWVLRRPAVWPSDQFLYLALRLLPVADVEEAMREAALHGGGDPRTLASFYHRVLDAVRRREASEQQGPTPTERIALLGADVRDLRFRLSLACPEQGIMDSGTASCVWCDGLGQGKRGRHREECPWVEARIALGENPAEFRTDWHEEPD
jgi:hypothetical protein